MMSAIAALSVAFASATVFALSPYLSAYGIQVTTALRSASIANVLFQYPGLTWQQLIKPEYADSNSVAPLVKAVDKVNLGARRRRLSGCDARGKVPALGPVDQRLPRSSISTCCKTT
ncbi:hypothetical protein ACWF9G_08750 [Nocardia sp. NPDC055029]|uniref:hypothetical protein n=1 Tax=Nocardia sp. NPDC060259 TaxID=3347088 RepID=UPI00364CF5C4